MNTVCLELGSMSVCIESNDNDFLKYTKSHFYPVLKETVEKPALSVTFLRKENHCAERDLLSTYERVGRGIYSDGKDVIWLSVPFFEGLRLKMSNSKNHLTIKADYVPVKNLKSRIKSLVNLVSKNGNPKNKFYFELMYHLVYYPVFWLLRKKGVFVLHGGAIQLGETGIVIVGAQGTGKSTLIVNMLPWSYTKFLSDNIILFDSNTIYSCYEPVRIDKELLSTVPKLGEYLSEIDLDVPLGRKAFTVHRDISIESLKPKLFIIPKISSSKTSLRSIPEKLLLSRALCFNTLADEVRTFNIFNCILSQTSLSEPNLYNEKLIFERLLEGKKCYEMNIKYGESPKETINKLEEIISTSE